MPGPLFGASTSYRVASECAQCAAGRMARRIPMALPSKTPAPTTGSRGRVMRMELRRVYPFVSELNAAHRQQMQSRLRAGKIQKNEFMILPFIPPSYGQANREVGEP